eukprot:CAMPEP_0177628950 /NCGR_PEP_ID=MMETSP0447-20121125/404_1 /TAXON_ID=0 /ORGANISM="Stygamoeba regulata, Strain BSH-02190019" /LENGTH=667 /DNA_ID=CAMNT_0019130231 /DNA_START=205 /DNA_END=2204 /DNA_ORIENTATION=-
MAAHPPPQHLQPPQRQGPTAQEHLNAAALCDAVYKAHSRSHLLSLYNRGFPLTITAVAATSPDTEDSFRYLVAHDQQETLYLAVRGTVDWVNWKTNLKAFSELGEVEGHVGQVHRGFFSLAKRLPMVELINEHRNGRRIVLCGHSLGGAVAALGTCLLLSRVCSDEGRVQCYTFGAPLFSDCTFAERYKRVEFCGVFSHTLSQHDLVPLVLTLNGPLRRKLENALPCVADLVVRLMTQGWGLAAMPAGLAFDGIQRSAYDGLKGVVSQIGPRVFRLLLPAFEFFGKAVFAESGEDAAAHFEFDNLTSLQFPECLQAHAFAHYLAQLKDRLAPGLMHENQRPLEVIPLQWAPKVQPSRSGKITTTEGTCTVMVRVTGCRLGTLEPLRAQDVTQRPLTDPLVVVHGTSECVWQLTYPPDELPGEVSLTLRSRFVDGAEGLHCGPMPASCDWHPNLVQRRRSGSLIELACLLAARLRFCRDSGDQAQLAALEKLTLELEGVDVWVAAKLAKAEEIARWGELFDRVLRLLHPMHLATLKLEPNQLVISFALKLFEPCTTELESHDTIKEWVSGMEGDLGNPPLTEEELQWWGTVPRLAEIVRAEGRGEALDFALDLHRFEVMYMFACVSTLRLKISTLALQARAREDLRISLVTLAVSSVLAAAVPLALVG